MLATESTASFDVLTAADVFIYIGRLKETIAQVAPVLRPNGVFAFSIEDMESKPGMEAVIEDRYQLNPSGRYAHSRAYIQQLAETKGLCISCSQQDMIRLDLGQPLLGTYVVLQKRASPSTCHRH